jgi:hypothetical protein
MSDFDYGSEKYFLDRLDTTCEKILETLNAIEKLENEALVRLRETHLKMTRREDDERLKATAFMFADIVSISQQPSYLHQYLEHLDDNTTLAKLAKAVTVIQSVIHTIVSLRREIEIETAETSPTLATGLTE